MVFNLVAGRALLDLYEAFPSAIDIEPIKIARAVLPAELPDDETFEALTSTADDTISFLVRNGFIEQSGHRYTDRPGLTGCTLSMRGLELLGRVPEAIQSVGESDKPVVTRLKDALDASSYDLVKSAMGAVLKLAITAGGALG